MNYKLCLVAVEGDKSAGALGDTNTVYLFDNKNKKYVDEFLKAQLNFELYSLDKDFPNKNKKHIYKKCLTTFHKLQELGILIDKWDFRTRWDIAVYDELADTKRYKPYKLEPNGFKAKKNWENLKERASNGLL